MNASSLPSQPAHRQVFGASQLFFLVISVLLLVAAGTGLIQGVLELNQNWTGKYGHFAHGYMALAFSIWLGFRAWQRRDELHLRPEWKALPVLMLLLGLMVAGIRLDITTAKQSLVPAIVIAAFTVTFGMGLLRLLWWPAMCVFFAVPAWWIINTPLQELTGEVSRLLVMLTGIPAIVQDNQFQLPMGIIEVALGCSGLNYLVAGLTLAYLYALLLLQTWPARIKLLCVAAVASLVVNWIRVFSLIWIAYATDMRHYLIRVDHLYYGWALFLLVLLPLFWAGARLERAEAKAGIVEPRVPDVAYPLQVATGPVLIAGLITAVCLLAPRFA